MAPHKALTILDILHEVFGHLSARPQLSLPDAELGSFPGFPSAMIDLDDFKACRAKRLALARAARTCKVFAEPASRTLWEVLDSLAPIVSILKNARTSEDEEKTCLWEQFEQITRRIRALLCRGPTGRGDVLSLICSRYNGRPIFPNLCVLSLGWGFHGAPYLAFLKAACASPTVVVFAIATYEPSSPNVLATVADMHQELIHLKAPFLRNFKQEIHRALAKFTNLHTAHFSTIDTTLFRHLAALPYLRTLGGRFDTSKPIMNIPGAFPALQELSTEDLNDGPGFRAVLPVLSSKSLARLSLWISVPLTEDMLEYLDELSSSPSLAHLRKLDLCVDVEFNRSENQDEPFEGVSFADVLTLLKRLSGLRDISAVVHLQTSR